MPPPDTAVVTVELPTTRLPELAAIPGVEVIDRPIWVSYPDRVRVALNANSAAQAAIRAAGFEFEVAITAADYQARIEDLFADRPTSPDEPA